MDMSNTVCYCFINPLGKIVSYIIRASLLMNLNVAGTVFYLAHVNTKVTLNNSAEQVKPFQLNLLDPQSSRLTVFVNGLSC